MIYFSQLGNYGRLGNQLFQYAAAKSLALQKGVELGLTSFDNKIWHGQQCLLKYFDLQYRKILEVPQKIHPYSELEANYWKFDESFYSLPDETDLFGFFQNREYFRIHEDLIKSEFKVAQEFEEQANQIVSKFDNPVSVHIRLGDYLDIFGSSGYLSSLLSYLEQSIPLFPSHQFLVVGGGSRDGDDSKQIEWAKRFIVGDNVFHVGTNNPLVDFCIIKQCVGNIMGFDSTFSWWASFLGNAKKVVAKRVMPQLKISSENLGWILI